MRSFIKSHRKATSLDESPSRSNGSPNSMVPQGDLASTQKTLDEPITFIPSTPSQILHNGTKPKHSPGFESFHRLANKKMFTSKLFKKVPSSSAAGQTTVPVTNTRESSTAPGTPQSRKSESAHDLTLLADGETKFPAIKGTITHAWGDHSDNDQPVIILNNPSSTDLAQDLEPAVRISSLRRGSAISTITTSSYENNNASIAITDDQSYRRNDVQRDRHVYNELSKVKSKNRQARIHSHDDIINLEKMSTVSLEILASTGSPSFSFGNIEPGDDQKEVNESADIKRLSVTNENVEKNILESATTTIDHLSPSVSFEDTPLSKTRKADDMLAGEDDTSDLLTPDVDEDEDDASKFSFELSGLNGRTSSVKYYSKPDPSDAVYIDDVYEDEIFDEDMNFYEDSFDDMEFPSNNFHVSGDESDDHSEVEDESLAQPLPQSSSKPVKKYNDLFDLSDDAEDDEYQYEATLMSTIYDDKEQDDELSIHSKKPEQESAEHLGKAQEEITQSKTTIKNDELASKGNSNVKRPHRRKEGVKTVKCFSDIFNLDDEEDDDTDDIDEDYCDEDSDRGYDNVSTMSQGSTSKSISEETALNNTIESQPVEDSAFDFDTANRPKTPVHIFVTSPMDHASKTTTISDPHLSTNLCAPSLPPPARSQTFKFHDLSSNLDSEVPGLMSNLYFIDESEEDKYNERRKVADDEYLDEINTVPEDFNFSDSEQEMNNLRSPCGYHSRGSFRSTHSYSSQPIGAAKESTPTRNKLEIKNKTVTFFNHPWDRSPTDRSMQKSPQKPDRPVACSGEVLDDYVISPMRKNGESYSPVTPTNSFNKPSPEYLNDYSLSPIQESLSSVDNSPTLPLQ